MLLLYYNMSKFNNLDLTANSSGFQISGGSATTKTLIIQDSGTITSAIYTGSTSLPFGEIQYGNGTVTTAITFTTAGTYFIVNPTVTFASNNALFTSNKFSSPSAGRLQYLGSSTS